MTETPTTPTPAPAATTKATKLKGGFVLKAIPVLAFAAFAGAVAAVFVFELNKLEPFNLYGHLHPLWVPVTLLVASVALAGVTIWRKRFGFAYLAAAPLLPLGTGSRLYLEQHALGILVFAACVFLYVEYLTALPRFEQIVRSTQSLDSRESTPVRRFLMRYLFGSIALIVIYAAFLYAFVTFGIPTAAGAISRRMGHGLENETAWGITIFAFLFLSLPILGRLIYDSIIEYRAKRLRQKAADAAAPPPPPVNAPKEAPQ